MSEQQGNTTPLRVLVLDDSLLDFKFLRALLPVDVFLVDHVTTLEQAFERSREEYDVYLIDYYLGHRRGTEFLRALAEEERRGARILITSHEDEELDSEARDSGADDFLVKGQFDTKLLRRSIRYALERRRSESRLKQSRDQLKAFLTHTPTVTFIKDDAGRYLFANPRYAELTGMEPEQVVGRTDYEIWPEETADLFTDEDAKVLEAGEALEFRDIGHFGGEGSEWLVVRFPLHSEQGATLLAGLAFDMSEQRRLEEQLNQVQKMDAVGRLAGGVAHDFNNLLSVILGNLEMLLPSASLEPDERELLLEVREAGKRAASLTRKLLAFSRRQRVERKPLRLSTVVNELQGFLRRLVREDIDLRFSIEQDAGTVLADPGQLEQILLNLVVNARDAIPGRGRIDVRCERRLVSRSPEPGRPEVEPGEYAALVVEDSGVGIPSDIHDRLYEPFFTTKGQDGTGLGLATVYGIVEQADGRVWFETEVGRGTAFHILLPLTDRPVLEQNPSTKKAPVAGGRHTVMLVEDEASLRRLGMRLLERDNHRVLECADGLEALRVLSSGEVDIDLLITDVVMPRMRGTELVRRARELYPELKVIFMSGYTEESFELDDHSVFLAKPFSLASLGQAVGRALSSPARA